MQVVANFFTFTERVFPILHRPTFLKVIDDLYNLDTIGAEWFEHLAQFYYVLSIGHRFDMHQGKDDRLQRQILALQIGVRCYFTTLHTRRDGLSRLQTLTISTTEGVHVKCISNQIVKYLITKKNKGAQVKGPWVKNHMWIFVNALIENSTFGSQTKEQLTLTSSKYFCKMALVIRSLSSVPGPTTHPCGPDGLLVSESSERERTRKELVSSLPST